MAWKSGYTLYAPNVQDIWHLWDRSYRPSFGSDAQSFANKKQKNLSGSAKLDMFDSKAEGDRIRRILYGDKKWRQYMDEVWGLDVLG